HFPTCFYRVQHRFLQLARDIQWTEIFAHFFLKHCFITVNIIFKMCLQVIRPPVSRKVLILLVRSSSVSFFPEHYLTYHCTIWKASYSLDSMLWLFLKVYLLLLTFLQFFPVLPLLLQKKLHSESFFSSFTFVTLHETVPSLN